MPDVPAASVCGVWFASSLSRGSPGFPVPMAHLAGILAALAVGLVGRRTIVLARELNRALYVRFKDRLVTGEVGPERLQLAGAAVAFARGFTLCLVAITILKALVGPAGRLAPSGSDSGAAAWLVMGGLGAGVLFNTFVRRSRSRAVAFVGGLVFAFLLRNFRG